MNVNIASSGAEAYEITGRWVAVGCGSATEEPDRLYLNGDDIHARDFEWEWVPYESDQIPVPNGRYVSWRCA